MRTLREGHCLRLHQPPPPPREHRGLGERFARRTEGMGRCMLFSRPGSDQLTERIDLQHYKSTAAVAAAAAAATDIRVP